MGRRMIISTAPGRPRIDGFRIDTVAINMQFSSFVPVAALEHATAIGNPTLF